jgi:hypothetical protein
VITRRDVTRRMLALEAVGFLLIVVIIWMDELFDLPHVMLGATRTPVRWGEGIIESVLTLLVGVAVVVMTTRAFRRIEYLESLIVMCAWCRRVRSGDEWLSVEHFLERQHQSRTSHGICEGCAGTITVPSG